MTSFEERHPGLKDKMFSDYSVRYHLYSEDVIDATQIDKDVLRIAIAKAGVDAALIFLERSGCASQQDLHACFVECLNKRLGL